MEKIALQAKIRADLWMSTTNILETSIDHIEDL